MSLLDHIGTGVLALCCMAACGGNVQEADGTLGADREPALPGGAASGDGHMPASSPVSEPELTLPDPCQPPSAAPVALDPATISEQRSADCVVLPRIEPRQPLLSYEEGCAVTTFEQGPPAMSESGRADARELLVGRWRLCGEVVYYGGEPHAGIEFGSNGRNQLLWRVGERLAAVEGGRGGVYTLLGSGQFMQGGDLSFSGGAARASFDATMSVLRLSALEDPNTPALRYVRVAPDEESAAANVFSTSALGCSMVGVWDTAPSSSNPPAAFAFNERGEWFGGTWGSELCASHSMYGTYNLETRGGNVMDNFDEPATTTFELVTNVGAGLCAFWFNAGFAPTFSADCNRVQLVSTFDNCTGGRGYLNHPGDELIRRVP